MDCLFILQIVLTFFCRTVSSVQGVNLLEVNSPSIGELTQNANYFLYQHSYPRDCQDVLQQCYTRNSSGVAVVKPNGISEPFEVFCDHDVHTGGWTVIQRRVSGSMTFNRSWTQYKEGFGFLSTEFWLGNEKLSYLTNQAIYELRVDVQMLSGATFFTTYKGFRITDEFGKYKIVDVGIFRGIPISSTCPMNMNYGTCICQTTCEDPTGESACHGSCSGEEGCVCAEGFTLNGTDCINVTECGCFLREANIVIPNGQAYVNDDCTRRCSCSYNLLTCENISCSIYASCVTSNDVRQCVCNEGYEGDGHTCEFLYRDCKDIYDSGNIQDGVYMITPSGWSGEPFRVYCKMDNGGGWTVFQKRTDGSTDFYRSWNEYKHGFGDLVNFNGNFWLGNDKLYYLTNQTRCQLRFDVTTSSGSLKYGEFAEFEIESENNNYKLSRLGTHSGTTGNGLHKSIGVQFSTPGRDNDPCDIYDCAEKHRSGWWHSDFWCSSCYGTHCLHFHGSGTCHTVCTIDNLNGVYGGGNGENILSCYYGGSIYCNLESVEMKIRPTP